MDPLTAALNAVTAALTLATKVWEATPVPQQQAAAQDWANFTHNIASFVTGLQAKIEAAVK